MMNKWMNNDQWIKWWINDDMNEWMMIINEWWMMNK